MLSVTFAIVAGTVIGFFITFLGVRHLIEGRENPVIKHPSAKGGKRVIWTVTVAAMPFVWFVAFVVGGNFGGAVASNLAEVSGIPEAFLVPIGIGTGLALFIAFLALGAALISIVVVRIFGRR